MLSRFASDFARLTSWFEPNASFAGRFDWDIADGVRSFTARCMVLGRCCDTFMVYWQLFGKVPASSRLPRIDMRTLAHRGRYALHHATIVTPQIKLTPHSLPLRPLQASHTQKHSRQELGCTQEMASSTKAARLGEE